MKAHVGIIGGFCELSIQLRAYYWVWKFEKCVASDLVAGGFTTDVSEGGETLAIPFVAAVEYYCVGRHIHKRVTAKRLF